MSKSNKPTLMGVKKIFQSLGSPSKFDTTVETQQLFPAFPFTVSVGLKAFLSILLAFSRTLTLMIAVSPALNVPLSSHQLKTNLGSDAFSVTRKENLNSDETDHNFLWLCIFPENICVCIEITINQQTYVYIKDGFCQPEVGDSEKDGERKARNEMAMKQHVDVAIVRIPVQLNIHGFHEVHFVFQRLTAVKKRLSPAVDLEFLFLFFQLF